MANLKLNHIFKVYQNGVKAVNDFCIDIKDQEFIVFVGPSGCGKSTTLRMIAGLEEITAGELYIGENLVNDIEPIDRDIAMVFQNYALYPHMTVYDNMAFGLVNRHTPKEEIKKRVTYAAEILGLSDYLDRRPKELSGGQCQRVALGRAIVRQPKVFLLDEPLSNLDAKLRASMRTEISKLHQQLQTTFIYVTHDQVEAMTMGTRIVVMKDGFVQQIDTPINLYNHPINKFVAGFIGTPQMNFLSCHLSLKDGTVNINFSNDVNYKINYREHNRLDSRYFANGKEVILGVRPDHFVISKNATGLKVKASIIEQLGNESILYGSLLLGKNEANITMKVDPKKEIKPGDIIDVSIIDSEIHFFDKETEMSISRVVPEYNYFEIAPKKGKITIFDQTYVLPPYLKEKLEGKVWNVRVPLDAITKGNAFKLNLVEQDDKYGCLCSVLDTNESYIFSSSLEKHKHGEVNFDIDWTKAKFESKNDEEVLTRVTDSFVYPIHFNKDKNIEHIVVKNQKTGETKEKDKKHFALSYMIGEEKHYLSFVDTDKVLNIFGNRKTFKDVYDLKIKFDDLDFENKTFTLRVIERIDYGFKKFVKVDFFGTKVIVPDMSKGEDEISFSFNPKDIEILEHNSNMRII